MIRIFRLLQIISVWRLASANSANFTDDIYQLANEIIDDYLLRYTCMTYAADDVSNVHALGDLQPMFVINLSVPWGDSLNDALLVETYEQGCGGYIVQTRVENRLKIARKLKDAKRAAVGHRYNKERYLFLATSPNDTNTDFLLDGCMYFMPNLVFVTKDESSGSFVINNNAVFDPDRKKSVEVVDTWTREEGFRRRSNLYWDKTDDVNGRTMMFGVMQYIPYSVIFQEGGQMRFDGIEYRIAQLYLKRINASFAAQDHPKHLWGTKFPNGSGNGILGSVLSGESDFGYAAVYQWYCDVVDCTFPYIQAEAICLVPRPQVLSSWYTLWLPFTTSTWTGISIAFFVSFCFVFTFTLTDRHIHDEKLSGQLLSSAFNSVFNLYRLQLQQVPGAANKKDAVGTYFKISLVCYFLLSIFWQGGIASLLTVPRYEKPIDTPAQLVAKWPKMEWGANHRVWIWAIENSTDPILKEVVKKFRVLDNDTLIRKSKTRDFGFFCEKLPNKHYGFNDYINEETVPHLRPMKENTYTASTVFILPRGSPFTEKLDHMIHWLYATGVIQKIENQVSIERINNHLQTMILFSDEKEELRSVLTVERIEAALIIYFLGIFLSTIVLIGEKILSVTILKKLTRTKVKRILPPN